MRPLNLATRPFRNEQLPSLLVGLALVALLALTVRHGVLLARVLPNRTTALHQEVAALERAHEQLRREARDLRAPRPEAKDLAEWMLLKDLVDRRTFSWTGLFAVLEETLPPGVRLVSIAPQVKKGQVSLELSAVARSYQEGIDFIRVLEDRPEFGEVYPVSRAGEEGTEFRYTMQFLPQAARGPVAGTSPPPQSAGAEDADDYAGDYGDEDEEPAEAEQEDKDGVGREVRP